MIMLFLMDRWIILQDIYNCLLFELQLGIKSAWYGCNMGKLSFPSYIVELLIRV